MNPCRAALTISVVTPSQYDDDMRGSRCNSGKGLHTYCPWSGKEDCGCTEFPHTWEGIIPKKCESHLSLASAEVHVQEKRVSPELAAEVKRWVAAGRPRLDRWVGEDDGD